MFIRWNAFLDNVQLAYVLTSRFLLSTFLIFIEFGGVRLGVTVYTPLISSFLVLQNSGKLAERPQQLCGGTAGHRLLLPAFCLLRLSASLCGILWTRALYCGPSSYYRSLNHMLKISFCGNPKVCLRAYIDFELML